MGEIVKEPLMSKNKKSQTSKLKIDLYYIQKCHSLFFSYNTRNKKWQFVFNNLIQLGVYLMYLDKLQNFHIPYLQIQSKGRGLMYQ